MTKAERLAIETRARSAVGREYHCSPVSRNTRVGERGPVHEFDVYAEGIVIGGISTSPLKTGGGNSNTGGCDRACAELLWLLLRPGPEARIHVLTDRPMAEWLVNRFRGATYPHPITIYHYDVSCDALTKMGVLYA
ncbi:MAG: hypothetical protein HY649_07590 [Acidobacteria bacterium]|nr:hypothetical protein [Acidobacteriota bacterium]